jgi:hypothetical protein
MEFNNWRGVDAESEAKNGEVNHRRPMLSMSTTSGQIHAWKLPRRELPTRTLLVHDMQLEVDEDDR